MSPASFSFGPFVLAVAARALVHHGEPVHLTPKAFDLLALLAERSPDAVSKTEILERLWPDTYVSDVSVAALVFEVRSALGESARAPRFIRTVHGFGYAFTTAPASPPATSPYLVRVDGRDVPLPHGESLVGRAPDCQVRLDSAKVSRRHARFLVADGRVTLEDCGSSNGTWVNSARIDTPVTLADGDEVRFGPVVAVLRRVSLEAVTEPVTA